MAIYFASKSDSSGLTNEEKQYWKSINKIGYSSEKDTVSILSNIIQQYPNDYSAYLIRAATYSEMKEHDKSIEDNKKAIEMIDNGGESKLRDIMIKKKVEIFMGRETKELDKAEAFSMLAKEYLSLKDCKLAAVYAAKSIEMEPTGMAYATSGIAKYSDGDIESGINDMKKAKELVKMQHEIDFVNEKLDKALKGLVVLD